MPKGKVVFVVEGELEKDFLQKQCGTQSIIRRVPSNGEDVALGRLALMVRAILLTIKNPSKVFVILDREMRDRGASECEAELLSELRGLGINTDISVHFADRMVENWIIADSRALLSEDLIVDVTDGAEGFGGKSRLKQAFRVRELTYSERVDGVRLLNKCSASAIAQKCESFARLYNSVKNAEVHCEWIER